MSSAPALSYWQASTAPFDAAQSGPVEGEVDVAVIGAGFTGLSAGLAAAKMGAKVAILEASEVLAGASGRNGGHCNAGTAHDFGALVASFGLDRARSWYRAHCDAVDTVERLTSAEGIDCDFRRCGRAKLAAKPAHYAKLEAAYDLLVREVDPNVTLVPADRIREEVGSGDGRRCRRQSVREPRMASHTGSYRQSLVYADGRHLVPPSGLAPLRLSPTSAPLR